MDATWEAFFQSWPLDPWVAVPLVLTALVYARGWRTLHRQAPHRFGPVQLYSFLGGLAALFVALASPLEPFADLLLQVHMLQHLLLMMVAPPLLWLGAPLVPLLRGLPLPVRSYWAAPFLRLRFVRASSRFLTHPVVAGPLFIVTTWSWHVPAFYEAALRSFRLARPGTWLFSRQRPVVLVADRAAVPEQSSFLALVDVALPLRRRHSKHTSFRPVHLFRRGALSSLRRGPTSVGNLRAGRPGRCRRAHVDTRLDCLLAAPGLDRQRPAGSPGCSPDTSAG